MKKYKIKRYTIVFFNNVKMTQIKSHKLHIGTYTY
jgi:hypothetical protein